MKKIIAVALISSFLISPFASAIEETKEETSVSTPDTEINFHRGSGRRGNPENQNKKQ